MMTKSVSLSAGALFDVNSATLKPAGKAELDKLAEHIRKMSEVQSVAIVGYTDSTGSEAYNKKLSLRRAIAVKNYLLDHGVPASVMSTLGMGEANPVASNATAAGRARNRRVEITIKGSEVHM
ncbi:MAG TPA: OmpA family protein [Gammaproteobacteria bacterium]|nr:OmpA family protein [Gammaproteobacteria bacterium]